MGIFSKANHFRGEENYIRFKLGLFVQRISLVLQFPLQAPFMCALFLSSIVSRKRDTSNSEIINMFDACDECIELINDGNGFTITAN